MPAVEELPSHYREAWDREKAKEAARAEREAEKARKAAEAERKRAEAAAQREKQQASAAPPPPIAATSPDCVEIECVEDASEQPTAGPDTYQLQAPQPGGGSVQAQSAMRYASRSRLGTSERSSHVPTPVGEILLHILFAVLMAPVLFFLLNRAHLYVGILFSGEGEGITVYHEIAACIAVGAFGVCLGLVALYRQSITLLKETRRTRRAIGGLRDKF
jgi:multisubunit Na+/H+ antiporter MnhG subunit